MVIDVGIGKGDISTLVVANRRKIAPSRRPVGRQHGHPGRNQACRSGIPEAIIDAVFVLVDEDESS